MKNTQFKIASEELRIIREEEVKRFNILMLKLEVVDRKSICVYGLAFCFTLCNIGLMYLFNGVIDRAVVCLMLCVIVFCMFLKNLFKMEKIDKKLKSIYNKKEYEKHY